MKVLSLFDGISCGMVALERAGIPVERYVAYEIEPNAIKISEKNYPHIEHCGDVTEADFSMYEGFDLLIGGSPCQDLSIANQKGKGLEGERSGLFWEYFRALETIKPKYFLLENVASMKKKDRDKITEILGVEPIMINSALVSAQQRKRLYWTNIQNIVQPDDKKIFLKDVLQDESILPCALRTRKDYTGSYKRLEIKKDGKANSITSVQTDSMYCKPIRIGHYNSGGQGDRIYSVEGKSVNLSSNGGGGGAKTGLYRIDLPDGDYVVRKLSSVECERLQTLPDGYTEGIPETNRIKVLGNGWTVDVIAHIFTGLIEKENKTMELRMNEYQLPEKILFNYEELKKELTEKVSMYETLVYTEENIKDAKSDRANLNKLKKALNDERIRREKEYMIPFNDFKSKINEIISIIDKPVAVIDKQVKEFEEQQKQAKMDAIKEYWESVEHPEALALEEVFDNKWLNASTSMKSIQDAITEAIQKFNNDMQVLADLPEYSFEAQQVYISSLDLGKAINEAHRLAEIAKAKAEREAAMQKIAEEQKAKAEAEAKAAEPQPQPAQEGFINTPIEEPKTDTKSNKQWITFQALLSTEDALALKQFFNDRNIEFRAV